ncbi:MAG: hypothetical protein ACSW8E_01775 [Clostridia bacterium]
MKKTVSILLALLLVFSLGVPAFASDSSEETGPKPTITKHPTGETVDEGGTAVFIASADYYNEIVWRIVSNDTTNTIQASDASSYFGCEVYGIGTERLMITKIPAEMDGWRVEAMFRGPGGVSFSNGALIRVNGVFVKAPTISAQPQGLSLASGETGTLSVSAATVEGTLHFQWFSNTANSNQLGTAIDGATEASYTPAEQTGTTYYYVEVTSVLNGRSSDPVLSNAVAVTYAAPVDPEAAPEPEPTVPGTSAPLVPVVNEPSEDNAPTGQNESKDNSRSAASAQERASNALNMLTIIGGILAVAAVVGAVTALIVRRRSDDEDDEDE